MQKSAVQECRKHLACSFCHTLFISDLLVALAQITGPLYPKCGPHVDMPRLPAAHHISDGISTFAEIAQVQNVEREQNTWMRNAHYFSRPAYNVIILYAQ